MYVLSQPCPTTGSSAQLPTFTLCHNAACCHTPALAPHCSEAFETSRALDDIKTMINAFLLVSVCDLSAT